MRKPAYLWFELDWTRTKAMKQDESKLQAIKQCEIGQRSLISEAISVRKLSNATHQTL